MSSEKKENQVDDPEEEQYVEEDDEDFDPNANYGDDNDFSASDEEEETQPKSKKRKLEDEKVRRETEKELANANYKAIESAEGGLIKTRSQRHQESQEEKQFKSINSTSSSVDIDDMWERLKNESKERLKHQFSASNISSSKTSSTLNSNRKIKIKRKYEYAGEIITEEKWVDAESAEAKAYISTLEDRSELETNGDDKLKDQINKDDKEQQRVNEKGEKLRKVYKRQPLLEGIINGSIKPKFNTLEKSRVDFAKFVDKEGINDELTQHNKNGYLEKQDFLSRVEFHRDSSIKEMRKKELMNKK